VLSQDDTHIEFQHTFANGLRVTKRFEFPAGAHHLLLTVTLHNAGQTTQTLQYELAGGLRVVPERQDQAYLFAMAARHEGGKNRVDSDDKMRPASVKKKGGVYPRDNSAAMPIVWVGSTNKYFAALLKPLAEAGADSTPWIQMARFRLLTGSEGQPSRLGGRERTPFDNVSTSVVTKEITLKAGESSDPHKYLFYVGPKSSRLLKQSPEYAAFAPVIDYGWFDFISITLLTLLQAFHKVIPNYGVAIILLTIVVRAALHPLTRKAQISMARMQKLAPEIKKLQEKFKHDKQRLGREQMELFKKQGVNPMGGCLPLLLQFPIIIGLYRALELSVDLRDAPFVFWVRDLSRPDTINAGGGFPINILPVVMIASWIVQQKMMPKSPDPQARRQQTMMTVMTTVLFGWIFYFIASGLTLYWLTSTLLGIAEQKFIQRSIRRMGEAQEAVA
jgi:YidC/Oxa1 family membrane protein insertase